MELKKQWGMDMFMHIYEYTHTLHNLKLSVCFVREQKPQGTISVNNMLVCLWDIIFYVSKMILSV